MRGQSSGVHADGWCTRRRVVCMQTGGVHAGGWCARRRVLCMHADGWCACRRVMCVQLVQLAEIQAYVAYIGTDVLNARTYVTYVACTRTGGLSGPGAVPLALWRSWTGPLRNGSARTPPAPARRPPARSSPKPIESTRSMPPSIPARRAASSRAANHPLKFRAPGLGRFAASVKVEKGDPSGGAPGRASPSSGKNNENSKYHENSQFAAALGEVATGTSHGARPRPTLTEVANHP